MRKPIFVCLRLCAILHRVTSELEQAVRAYRRAEKAFHARRSELLKAMMEATDASVPQKEICEVTGWSREYVRRMVAEARKEAGEAT
jgi:hypothetical protein